MPKQAATEAEVTLNVRQRWLLSLFVQHAAAELGPPAISAHTGFDLDTVSATLEELARFNLLTLLNGRYQATEHARTVFGQPWETSVIFSSADAAQMHGQAEYAKTGQPHHVYFLGKQFVAAIDAQAAAKLLGAEASDVQLTELMTSAGEYDVLQLPFTERRGARLRAIGYFKAHGIPLDVALFKDGSYRLLLSPSNPFDVQLKTPQRVILSQITHEGKSINQIEEPLAREYLGLTGSPA